MQRSRIATPPKVRVAHAQIPGIPESENEYEYTQPKRTSTPTRSRNRKRAPLIILAGVAALLVLLLALPVGYGIAYNGRILKGVHVLNADLGGMSRTEAQAALSKATAGYPSGSITVSGSGHT